MPLNVLGGIPIVATDYSPIWDLNKWQWTQRAIDNGYLSRMLDEFTLLGFVEKGRITGPMASPFGSSGIVLDCTIDITSYRSNFNNNTIYSLCFYFYLYFSR
jgi:hypothetical protein